MIELALVRYKKEVHTVKVQGQPIVEPIVEPNISHETTEASCPICMESWENAEPPRSSRMYTPTYDLAVNEVEVLDESRAWDSRTTRIARFLPVHFRLTRPCIESITKRLRTNYAEASDANEASIVKIVGCNHVFHHSCLRTWMKKHQNCPMCRMNVREMPEVSESTSVTAPIESDVRKRNSAVLIYWPRRGLSRRIAGTGDI